MNARPTVPRVVAAAHAALERLRARPRATDAVVAAALTALLLPQSLVLLLGLRTGRGWPAAVVAALVALHLTPALRRTAPVAGYALACAAMLTVVAAPNGELTAATGGATVRAFPMVFLPSSLLFLPALNAVAVHGRRRYSVLALLAALAGAGLALVRVGQAVTDAFGGLQYRSYVALAFVIAVLSAWGFGAARVTRTRLEAAARVETARTAILAERSRIAQDMHDIVAHSLVVVVRLAEAGALLTTRSPERARQMLETIADTGRDALKDMRGMVDVLRDPDAAPVTGTAPVGGTAGGAARTTAALGDAPVPGPQPTLDDLPAVLDRIRATGVEVGLRRSGTPLPLGAAVQLAGYHVVQEALTNTVKHAGTGARVEVRLEWLADRLVVQVEDDGGSPGSSPSASPVPGAGVGLAGLRERVAAVGGSLHAERHGRGFAVRAELPAAAGGPVRAGTGAPS